MKNFFIITLLVAITSSKLYSQVWEQLPNLSGIPSLSISFPTPDVGYGGYSVTHENPNLNKTYIFKTTNKGVNWNLITEFSGSRVLNGDYRINFINESIGWIEFVITYPAANPSLNIYKTTNGGGSWQLMSQPAYNYQYSRKIKFINENTGYRLDRNVTASPYFTLNKTTNGGANWSELQTTNNNLFLSDFEITPQNVVYLSGFYQDNSRTFLKKFDNGNNVEIFNNSNPPSTAINKVFDISVINENNIDNVLLFAESKIAKYSNSACI